MSGKTHQDRELAAAVRSLALEEIKMILEGTHDDYKEDPSFKKAILLKMSSSILPRLQEHSGAGGEPLVIKYDSAFNETPQKTEGDS